MDKKAKMLMQQSPESMTSTLKYALVATGRNNHTQVRLTLVDWAQTTALQQIINQKLIVSETETNSTKSSPMQLCQTFLNL